MQKRMQLKEKVIAAYHKNEEPIGLQGWQWTKLVDKKETNSAQHQELQQVEVGPQVN